MHLCKCLLAHQHKCRNVYIVFLSVKAFSLYFEKENRESCKWIKRENRVEHFSPMWQTIFHWSVLFTNAISECSSPSKLHFSLFYPVASWSVTTMDCSFSVSALLSTLLLLTMIFTTMKVNSHGSLNDRHVFWGVCCYLILLHVHPGVLLSKPGQLRSALERGLFLQSGWVVVAA